jgi:galactokinase
VQIGLPGQPDVTGKIACDDGQNPQLPAIYKFALGSVLDEKLKQRYNKDIPVILKNDCTLGTEYELSKKGTFKGKYKSGGTFLVGSGLNIQGVEGNSVFTGKGAYEGVMIEPGHKITAGLGNFDPATGHFTSRLVEWKGDKFPSKSDIDAKSLRFEAAIQGSALNKFARKYGYFVPTEGDNNETKLPDLTEAASKGDEKAREVIELYSIIAAKGYAAFIATGDNIDSECFDHVALISTVFQKLGRDVGFEPSRNPTRRSASLPERELKIKESFEQSFGFSPSVIARGPGRANSIGEHVDYPEFKVYINPEDGSMMVPHNYSLPFAVQQNVLIAAKPRSDGKIVAHAVDYGTTIEIDLNELDNFKQKTGNESWVNYLMGAYQVAKENGWKYGGAEFVIQGNVPLAAGMSSSAALCVGIGFAFSEMFGWDKHNTNTGKLELALFAQKAEHKTGSNCGLLDQLASIFGKEGDASLIDYGMVAVIVDKLQKGVPVTDADVEKLVQNIPLKPILDKGYKFILVNSNVQRPEGGLAGTAYNTRVEELVKAGKILSRLLGSPWAPHVSCYTLEQLKSVSEKFNQESPVLYKRAYHVLSEKQRVLDAVEAMKKGDIDALAKPINETGDSLSMEGDFEISGLLDLKSNEVIDDTLDVLVKAARESGAAAARMMGGGGGGCAILLVKNEIDTPAWRERIINNVKGKSNTHTEIAFLGDAMPSVGAGFQTDEDYSISRTLAAVIKAVNFEIGSLSIGSIGEIPDTPMSAIVTALGVLKKRIANMKLDSIEGISDKRIALAVLNAASAKIDVYSISLKDIGREALKRPLPAIIKALEIVRDRISTITAGEIKAALINGQTLRVAQRSL